MQACVAEFIGTAILILLGNGVVANVVLERTKGHGSGWIVIAFGWGMAVFVGVWCVAAISGAHLNPAVTLGLAAAGNFRLGRCRAGYIAAQLLGAIFGAVLVFMFYRDPLRRHERRRRKAGHVLHRPGDPLAAVELVQRNRSARSCWCSRCCWPSTRRSTSARATTRFGQRARSASARSARCRWGCWCWRSACRSAARRATRSTRPAISGPRIAHALLPVPGKRDSDWGYAWIPVVGPLLGALLAVGVASLLSA